MRTLEMMLNDRQLKLLSAALRHIRDAEHLLESGSHTSPDQAFHLAGFGPECARKATLSSRVFDKAIGHPGEDDGDKALRLALLMDATAARYRIRDWFSHYPALAFWNVACRYDETGTHEQNASATVKEAGEIVRSIASALWMDGRVPRSFKW